MFLLYKANCYVVMAPQKPIIPFAPAESFIVAMFEKINSYISAYKVWHP